MRKRPFRVFCYFPGVTESVPPLSFIIFSCFSLYRIVYYQPDCPKQIRFVVAICHRFTHQDDVVTCRIDELDYSEYQKLGVLDRKLLSIDDVHEEGFEVYDFVLVMLDHSRTGQQSPAQMLGNKLQQCNILRELGDQVIGCVDDLVGQTESEAALRRVILQKQLRQAAALRISGL